MTFRPEWDGQACSLGYDVADWIEAYCCHGPGDLQGEPVGLDEEWLRFLVEAYRLDPQTGRRVYSEGVLSRAKGRAKSELAAFVATAEAFGPVRFDGWDAYGQPIGRPVTSPLIKCLATEEGQAGNTFEVLAFVAASWGPDAHPEVYAGVSGARQYQSATALYLPHGGEARACTAGAASKDGGRETFVVADETHLYVLAELRSMYATVRRNLGKRKIAQPWLLQTTTAYRPGERSVAEETLGAWRRRELGPEVLVDHLEARGKIDLDDEQRTLAQLREAYGAAAGWIDLPGVYRLMRDPRVCPDEQTAARYFLNRSLAGGDAFVALDAWRARARPELVVEPGESIALGFDGSLNDDTTVLRGCRMSDGHLFTVGAWAKPPGVEGLYWQVPRLDVLATVREAFARYDVVRMYADPHEWRSDVDTLAEELGARRVVPWETRRDLQMSRALDRLRIDVVAGNVTHDGDPLVDEHYGNAVVRRRGGLRLVQKPAADRKIDAVVTDALALEARADAIADGANRPPVDRRVVVLR